MRDAARKLAVGSATGSAFICAWNSRCSASSAAQASQRATCCSTSCCASSASSPYKWSVMFSRTQSQFILPSFNTKTTCHPERSEAESRDLDFSLHSRHPGYPIPSPSPGDRVGSSPRILQRRSQLLCPAKQRVLCRLFRRIQNLANRAQLQSLVVLHLEHHALARR